MTARKISRTTSSTFALLAGVTLCILANPAQGGDFSAMVADVQTGAILVADQIDASRDPELIARLSAITMGIQDIVDETLDPEEALDIHGGENLDALTALQVTALGEEGYRAPMTALAARIGYNAQLFEERIRAIGARAGLKATTLNVVRGADGGPGFEGRTTLRDTVRLAISLVRSHREEVDDVFGLATGFLDTTHIWMSAGDTCLLLADGPGAGRMLAASISGAPDFSSCFEAAATLLVEQDARILKLQ